MVLLPRTLRLRHALVALLLAATSAVPAAMAQAGPDRTTERQQMNDAADGLEADVERINAQDAADPFAQIEPLDIAPAGDSIGEQSAAILRELLNGVLVVRNTYLGELDAMGWAGILDGDRLKADRGMKDSRRMITLAHAAVDKADASSVAVFGTFEQIVGRSKLSPNNQRSMINGFNSVKDRGIVELRETFAMERETIGHFGSMIELLDRAKWEVEDGQVVFHSDEDVDTFNFHFDRINALTEELASRQQRKQGEFKQKLDRLRE